MKRTQFLNLCALVLLLALSATGCKHNPKGVTPIRPAATGTGVKTPDPKGLNDIKPSTGGTIPGGQGANGDPTKTEPLTNLNDPNNPFKQGNIDSIEGMVPDTNYFRAQTVYFDFDSAVVKTAEHDKVNFVGDELKKKTEAKLMVDGHTDERGTEEYNRALGERRALALREYLVKLGIAPERIRTRTWGENRPADMGHDESAFAKNRRGEFILLLPPKN